MKRLGVAEETGFLIEAIKLTENITNMNQKEKERQTLRDIPFNFWNMNTKGE
jgi:hypothetical protein